MFLKLYAKFCSLESKYNNRKIGKANAPVALQASIRANRATKDTQDIKMTDNTATGEDNTDNAVSGKDSIVHVYLPPHFSGKAKHPQAKLKHPQNIQLQLQNLQ